MPARRKKATVAAPPIRVRIYPVISDGLEAAVRMGVRRAYKHTDNPTQETIVEEVHREVMNQLNELLEFPDE